MGTKDKQALRSRLEAIKDETGRLAKLPDLDANQTERVDVLAREFESVKRELDIMEIRELASRPGGSLPGDNSDVAPTGLFRRDPWQTDGGPFESAHEMRSRALTAVERWRADDELKEAATETVERTLESNEPGVARHVLITSDPAYVSAFGKFVKAPETGYQEFTEAERAAWSRVKEHQRALALSGSVVPSPLDPSIVLSNAGTLDPMRGLARVEQTTSTSKRFITSAGVEASFDAEAATVSDDSPSLTEVEVVTAKAQAFVAASIEAFEDQPNLGMEVAKMFGDAKARLEGSAFITGSGTNAPKGIQTALDGGASELAPAVAETFSADDVYSTLEALPPRWRSNATWQAELSTLNTIHRFWNPQGTEPPLLEGDRLLRRPVVENSNLDAYSDFDAAATADNFLLYVADWSQYLILDRVGLAIEFVPLLMSTDSPGRPTGQRGWFAYWRVGADVATINAFRVMSVPTAA